MLLAGDTRRIPDARVLNLALGMLLDRVEEGRLGVVLLKEPRTFQQVRPALLADDRLASDRAHAAHKHDVAARLDLERLGYLRGGGLDAFVENVGHEIHPLLMQRLGKGDGMHACSMRDAGLCDKGALAVPLDQQPLVHQHLDSASHRTA